MHLSREQAHAVVEQANAAGKSLDTIAASVAQINDMSNQIASAAVQQSMVTDEINQNIVRISDMARYSSESSGKTAEVSQALSLLAVNLENTVSHFKM